MKNSKSSYLHLIWSYLIEPVRLSTVGTWVVTETVCDLHFEKASVVGLQLFECFYNRVSLV